MKEALDSQGALSTPRETQSSKFSFPKTSLFRRKAAAEELDAFAGLKGNELIQARLKYAYEQDDTLPRLIDDEHIREQSLDDYYIKLKIVLKDGGQDKSDAAKMESVEGNKRPIDITELFDQIEGEIDSGEASKLLLLGAAGIGKSTLMHYMSYRWGKGNLWNDKYDFVFRVRLKNLLNNDWKSFYEAASLRDNPLECFVHSCLPRELQREISVSDIVGIFSSSEGEGSGERVLLLLDGYDEVASKVAEAGSVPDKIFDQVFDCQNIILTSRPNAIRDSLKKKFERVIENVGLDQYGIEQYIDNAFRIRLESAAESEDAGTKTNSSTKSSQSSKKVTTATDGQVVRHSIYEDESGKIARFKKESQVAARDLKDFLSHNSTIKDICTIPINTALVCLIWRDAREKLFAENFNMSTLYKEVVLWLGKRHLKNFNEKFIASELEQIDADSIYDSNELKSLKKAAYRGFADSEDLILSGKEIKRYIKDIWPTSLAESEDILDLVHKFGLLKSEQDSKNLLDNDFTFIHLTFQEYLMALSFREMLENNDILDARGQKQTIGEFLATHREEPRYLRSLQFLTAIIEEERTNPDQTVAQAQKEKTQIIVTRFWESMSCNIDGIIELGIEGKAKLLMYLLGQVKKSTQESAEQLVQIPNLQKMRDFIDEEIFKDVDHWIGDLKASEYIPQRLDDYITEKLSDLQSNAEIISGLFDLISIAKYSTEKLTKIIEGIIATLDKLNISQQVETKEEQDEEIVKTNKTPETSNWHLQKAILTHLPKIVRNDLDFDFKRDIIAKYQQFIEQIDNIHSDVKLAAIDGITQIGSNMGLIKEVVARLLPELQASDSGQSSDTHIITKVIGKTMYAHPEIIDVLQQFLLPMLEDKRYFVRKSTAKLINKSLQLKADTVDVVFGYLLPKMFVITLTEQDSIAQILAKCANKKAEVADIVMSKLISQLKNKDPETTLKLVEKYIIHNGHSISPELIDNLINMLKGNEDIRGLSAKVIRKIIHQDQEGEEYTEYVLRKLQPLLGSWTKDIRETAEMLVRECNILVEDKASLSTKTALTTKYSVLEGDTQSKLLMDLQSDDINVVVTSLRIIVGYAKATNTMPEGLLEHFPKLFRSSDSDLRQSAVYALRAYMEVAKSSPEILSSHSNRAFYIIQKLAQDWSWIIKQLAGDALAAFFEVMKDFPAIGDYMQKAFDIINSLAHYYDPDVKASAENALSKFFEVMKDSPEIFSQYSDQAFGIIQELAHDDDYDVRQSAGNALSKFFEVMKDSPEIFSQYSDQAFGIIQELAHDNNSDVREAAVNALSKFFEVMKDSPAIVDYMQKAFDLINSLAQDNNSDVREAAVNALSKFLEIMKDSPAIVDYMQKVFDLINSLAHAKGYNSEYVKEAAVNALSKLLEVMKDSPAIGEYMQKAFDLINSLAHNNDPDVKAAAVNALSKFFEVMKDSPAIGEYMQQAFDIINSWAHAKGYNSEYVKEAAVNALSKFFEVMKDSPAIGDYMQKAFDIINSLAQEEDWRAKKAAVNALSKFFEVMKDSPAIGDYMQKAFDIIHSLVQDENWKAKQSAGNTLSKFLEVMQDSPAIGDYMQQAFDIIHSWAQEENWRAKQSAGNALSQFLKVMKDFPAIGDYMQKAFDIINSLAHAENDEYGHAKASAGNALSKFFEVMKDSPEIGDYMQKAFDLINSWAHDEYGFAKQSAVKALVEYMEVAKSSSEILSQYSEQALGVIQELAKNSDSDIRVSSVKALTVFFEVMKDSPEILSQYSEQALGVIQELAKNSDSDIRASSVKALTVFFEVIESSPEILSQYSEQALGVIQEFAHTENKYCPWNDDVRESAVKALAAFFEVVKDSSKILSSGLLQQSFGLVQELAHTKNKYCPWNDNVRESAVKVLAVFFEVMKDSSEILSPGLLQQSFGLVQELAKDVCYDIRTSAVKALAAFFEVMKDSSETLSPILLQQSFGIVLELAKDENWRAKQSAGNILAVFFEVMKDSSKILSPGLLQQSFGLIQEVAKDSDLDVRESAANALVAFFEVAKDSSKILSPGLLQQSFGLIQEVAKDSDLDVRESAANALVAFFEVIKDSSEIVSSGLLQQSFGLVQELARTTGDGSWRDKSSDVRELAVKALTAFFEVTKDLSEILSLELLQQAFGIINSLAQEENWTAKEAAINALSKLLEVMKDSPEIFSQYSYLAFDIIEDLAGHKTQSIAEPATGILGEYLYYNPTLANKEFLFKLLAYFEETKIENSVLKGFSVYIVPSHDYKLVKVLSDKYLPLLSSDNPVMKQVAVIVLIDSNSLLIKCGDYSLVKFVTPLLKFEQKFKVPVLKTLATGIEGLAASDTLTNLEKISKVTEILKYNKQIKEEAERELVEDSDDADVIAANEVILAAKRLLVVLPEILINNIPDENDYSEFIGFLEFINAEFDSVYSDGARKPFEKLYVKVLEFEALNSDQMLDVSRELILKLLAQGFTTSFDLRNNDLIFEGKHYKIVSDDAVMQEFAEQAAEGSARLGNKLAKQCVDHTPLFASSGSAISVAATDIGSCTGVLSRQELDHRTYNASLVVRSNHENEVLGSFILLEYRLITGQYRYCKITLGDANTSNGWIVKISDAVDLMPSEVRDNLSVIFDKMEYAKIGGRYEQPLYYALTRVSIDRDVIKELLLELNEATVVSLDALSYFAMRFGLVGDREEGGDELVDNPTYSLNEFKSLSDITMWHKKELLQLEAGSDEERVYLENEASFILQQFTDDKDYSQKQITELSKLAKDLKTQFDTLDQSAKDTSNQFALLQEVNDTSHQRIDALLEEQSSLQSRLDSLKEKQEVDHRSIEEMDVVKTKLAQLNSIVDEVKSDVSIVLEYQSLFEQLRENSNILERVLDKQRLYEAKQEEVTEITSGSLALYKESFYKTLRIELNAGYLAAAAIESGWVRNSKKGKFGNLGSFVKEVSGFAPLVGPGVKMLVSLLKMVDSRKQKNMISKYAKFVVDVNEMNELAEEISRKLALSDLDFVERDGGILEKIKSILVEKTEGTLIGRVVGSVGKKACSVIPDNSSDAFDMAEEILDVTPDMLHGDPGSTIQNIAMEAASDRIAGVKEEEEEIEQIKTGKDHAQKVVKIIVAAIFAGKFSGSVTMEEKIELITRIVIEEFTNADSITVSAESAQYHTIIGQEEIRSEQEDLETPSFIETRSAVDEVQDIFVTGAVADISSP